MYFCAANFLPFSLHMEFCLTIMFRDIRHILGAGMLNKTKCIIYSVDVCVPIRPPVSLPVMPAYCTEPLLPDQDLCKLPAWIDIASKLSIKHLQPFPLYSNRSQNTASCIVISIYALFTIPLLPSSTIAFYKFSNILKGWSLNDGTRYRELAIINVGRLRQPQTFILRESALV